MLRKNRLQHTIAATYPLDDIAAAHEAVESGTGHGQCRGDAMKKKTL